MSSVKFDATLDTSKLDEGLKQSNQNFAEFAKNAEKAGVAVDSGFQKMTGSIKDQITQQKQLIKEITQDIRNLTEEAKNASSSGRKTEILGDLKGAKKALAEEKAALLGLQQQQIDGNKKEAESQNSIFLGLGKWALGLATVASAMKIGKGIIESTEGTAHKFEQGIEMASAATTYFFKSIASGDWTNFWDGMERAISGAAEYVTKMEEIDNLKNEQAGKNVLYDKDIAIAMSKTFDQDKENQKEVLRNINIVIDKTKLKHSENARLNKMTYDDEAEFIANKNGLEVEFVKNAVMAYSTHKEEFELGEKQLKLLKDQRKIQTTRGGGASDDVTEVLAKMGQVGQKASVEFTNWEKLTKKEKKLISDLYVDWQREESQSVIGPRRMEMRKETIEKQIREEAIANAKKIKDAKELDNKITATQKLLKTASDSERDEISKRLVLLEAEKKLIEWKNEAAKAMALNKPMKAEGATTAIQAIRDMAKSLGFDTEKRQKPLSSDLVGINDSIEANNKRAAKLRKDIADDENRKAKELADNFYEVADAAGYLSQQIGDSNRGLSDMLGVVSNIASSFSRLAENGAFAKGGSQMTSGEGITAGITSVTQIMGMIISQGIENKRVQDEWTNAIRESVHQAALLKIELLAYKEANLFGVENPYSRAIAGAKQYGVAMGELNKAAIALEGGQVQTGTKKVASGANVLKGAGAGAVLGTIIPGVGNLVGAAVGAIVGGLIGLFGAKKRVPVFESLAKVYGEIYNKDTFELNPKIIADYAKLDESTKKMVDNWKEIKETAQAAIADMKSNFQDLAGDLGKSLSDSLMNAFRNNNLNSAIDDFHKKVGDVIADLVYQMLFAQFMQPFFDKAQEGFFQSFGTITGDNGKLRQMTDKELLAVDKTGKRIADFDLTDDIETLGNDVVKGVDGLNNAMTLADQILRDKGFENGIGGSTDAIGQAALTGKTIGRQITEETGSELTGLFRRNADDQRKIRDYSKMAVDNLLKIERNTFDTVTEVKNAVIELKVIAKNTQQQFVKGI